MRVKVELNGHQHYECIIGEVLNWCSTARRFGEKWIEVPCVVLHDGKVVHHVALQEELRWATVTVLATRTERRVERGTGDPATPRPF